jgi:AcrR family transcriptional regulator
MSVKLDRQTLRARRKLREALLASVLQIGWEKTNTQSICAHAKVSRAAFEEHFADKEQLLLSAFDDLPGIIKRTDDKAFAFVRDLIVHVRKYYPLTRALRKRAADGVMPRLREVVADLVLLDLAPGRARGGDGARDVAAHYLAGAIVDAIVYWIDTGANDPRALEEMLRGMSNAARGELGPERTTVPEFRRR